jgi:predicted anti-sigma-YlaC factor YlaD
MKNSISVVLCIAVFTIVSCATNADNAAMRLSPGIVNMALPAVINSSESKLKKDPHNQKLVVDAGSYNIMYANAFIQGRASMLPPSKYEKRDKENLKAQKYYASGVEILSAGLEDKYPGITKADAAGITKDYLPQITKEDVPLIYWLTAGTLCAFANDPFDLKYGSKIAPLSVLIKKAYELDPDYNTSTLDEFFFLYYASLPPDLGGDKAKAKEYYERAIEKTKGRSAGVYVAWAEAMSIPSQNYKDFVEKLKQALAINAKKTPDIKLLNILAQRKARHYLENSDQYFLDTSE